ncbi:chemotaxis protein CheW (plasmid) [Methylobacterium sp. NMS12]|uniref:chemotaxis protein CheW n=1 Tax=Methylobacterium sp. NMS12 TaxID=3079766 RepID=UPI003F881E6F
MGKGRYLVFTLWADDYALEADAVRELLRPPPLIRVPGAPPALSGLANLRGAPLPVLDLRRVVRPGWEPDAEPSRVIVANAGEPVGLLVDRVIAFSGGTVSVDEGGPSASRRLILSGSGEARLIDLPTLVTEIFPRRARMTGSGTAQGARGIAPARIEAEAERVALVTFTAGGRTYALPLERVAEVMALPVDVVPVPRAAEAALGVIGLRGGVLPLLSLAALLGLGMNAADSDARVVVTRIGGRRSVWSSRRSARSCDWRPRPWSRSRRPFAEAAPPPSTRSAGPMPPVPCSPSCRRTACWRGAS